MRNRWTTVLLVLAVVAGAQLYAWNVRADDTRPAATSARDARASDATQDMIRKVENGLAHEIQIGSQAPANLEERIESLQIPGLSIAVVDDFQVEWVKNYGVSDSRSTYPVTDETIFQVASISKCMAAVVTLRLVQEGFLDLDTDVNTYLKRWKVPENEFTSTEKVTLRRLLSHTAGLTVSGFRGYEEGEDLPKILDVLYGRPPANNAPIVVDMVPGSRFRYSGGGYTVLQLLLEDVTGLSMPRLLDNYVFKPAGMTHSTLCPVCAGARPEQISMGHSVDSTGKVTAFKGYTFFQGGSCCCELWTTASDLARFIVAIQKALRGDPGSILSRDMAKAMLTPEKGNPAGLGFFVKRYGDALYFNHDGGNVGFSARLIGHPEKGYGFAVTVNSDNVPFTLAEEVTVAVARAYSWDGIRPVFYKDAAALIAEIRQKREAAPDDPAVGEDAIIQKGYRLLAYGYADAAIEVFLLNLEFHPRSANCSDSAAEAYEQTGDAVNALKYYRQAIDLLNRFPQENTAYERSRLAATEKIKKLEGDGGK